MQERSAVNVLSEVRKFFSCNIKVHPDCYGIAWQEDWTCDICQDPGGSCILCPPAHSASNLSPMRRTSDLTWAHLYCKVYLGIKFINEAFLDKDDRESPIKGLEYIDTSAFCLKCSICNGIMTGFCVNCSEPACVLSFHPFCAMKNCFKIESPLITCQEHASPNKNEVVKMPAHKIKEQRKIQTKQLNYYFHQPRPLKKTNRSRNSKTINDFHKVNEYFAMFPLKILNKSVLPYDKSGFSMQNYRGKVTSRCRVLFQWFLKDFLLGFKVSRKDHTACTLTDDFIIIPRVEEPKELKYALTLNHFSAVSKETSIEYELLSRCLNETLVTEDEVTKEILYSLEYFSRKIIPVVNANKQLISRVIDRTVKLDLEYMQNICNESWICMQWTLIYKNLYAGLQDKSFEYYDSRDESMEIKKVDCCICFNYDEDNAILNPIVYCYGCKLFMHRACIGIHSPPENFMCQVCLSKSSPQCFLCYSKEWPMKNVNSQWFHITCALWDERAEFDDKKVLEGLHLTGTTRLGSCFICHKPNGLLSECQECSSLSHLMCAFRAGMKFNTTEMNRTQRRLQAGFTCNAHDSQRDFAMQKKLRYNAFLNYLSPRLKKKRTRE